MKLIKQTSLFYQESTSDKVYEVDLCEVGQDRYVVNFRYGRRGTSLNEGTKTPTAVSDIEATNIFDELVASKVKKGYRDAGGQPAPPKPARPARSSLDREARQQAILHRLAEAAQHTPSQPHTKPGFLERIIGGSLTAKSLLTRQQDSTWPLERVIWRAGELHISEAGPFLLDLIGSGDALRDYCLIWALGWCSDQSAIPELNRLYSNASAPDMVRRIAAEALLKLLDDQAKVEFRANLVEQLPPELRDLTRKGPADDFAAALDAYLKEGDPQRFAVLDTLYLIDNEHSRPALLDLLRTVPLQPNYFQRLRHIFKAAEYRRDGEVFGIIAYRFEKERAMFRNSYHTLDSDTPWSYVYLTDKNRYIQNANQQIRSSTSEIAYSSRTRTYLRQRVWRTLRRLGDLASAEYVEMAVGVLLPYSDADAQPVKRSSIYNYRTGQTRHIYWDAYAGYWAFNHILYTNSPRYILKPNSVAWRCRPSYKPGGPPPQVREEALPHLWDQAPMALLRLVLESNCEPVLQFAVRALGDGRKFCAELPVDTVVKILSRLYEITARFGFDLAKDRYRLGHPDHALALAVANCALTEARRYAHHWIDDDYSHFLDDSDFLVALATSPFADTRAFAQRFLRSSAFSEAMTKILIARLIAHLLTLDNTQTDFARDMAETIFKSFGPQLRALGLEIVGDLLARPLLEIQELGANILLNHDLPPNSLPGEMIQALIASSHETIRGIGMRLFGQLSDETLLSREDLLVSLALHELPDIRSAVRPIIQRLSEVDQKFAGRLSSLFIKTLLNPETYEGLHKDIVRLLREDMGRGWMMKATRLTASVLISAQSTAAQELGGWLIDFRVNHGDWADEFETDQLVELSNHEILAVRRAAQTVFMKVIHRFQSASNPNGHVEEMSQAIRLLDCRWDDSRQFWFDIFWSQFGAEDFTPTLLVGICDSVRPEVQQFGRELITRFFEAASGQEYLLKLSEHPSAELQLFATNYLERYAANNPARIKTLTLYFISVLSRVNKARVAKNRVMVFLTSEAIKNEETAGVVVEILTRQSVTIAIGDKAAAIEAMLKIQRTYPLIPLPIKIKEPEVRHAV